jgi:FAD/FMN-containing dehydrogenase
MTRFKDINVDAGAATVEVGAGLTWDQVYAVLEPYGINVVGGRVPGVGVAGLTLGGGECTPFLITRTAMQCIILEGYAWISKQYGLTVDNVAGYELVLPNGTITSVTSNDADLWFALRVSRYSPCAECSR